MPKISEIKEICRAVEPPPHTAHTPTTHHQHSNTDTSGLLEMFCFVYVSPYHTIIRQRLARVGGESKKVPLQNCVYNNKVQRDSNCVTTLT